MAAWNSPWQSYWNTCGDAPLWRVLIIWAPTFWVSKFCSQEKLSFSPVCSFPRLLLGIGRPFFSIFYFSTQNIYLCWYLQRVVFFDFHPEVSGRCPFSDYIYSYDRNGHQATSATSDRPATSAFFRTRRCWSGEVWVVLGLWWWWFSHHCSLAELRRWKSSERETKSSRKQWEEKP